jgi:hypothetical protein
LLAPGSIKKADSDLLSCEEQNVSDESEGTDGDGQKCIDCASSVKELMSCYSNVNNSKSSVTTSRHFEMFEPLQNLSHKVTFGNST